MDVGLNNSRYGWVWIRPVRAGLRLEWNYKGSAIVMPPPPSPCPPPLTQFYNLDARATASLRSAVKAASPLPFLALVPHFLHFPP